MDLTLLRARLDTSHMLTMEKPSIYDVYHHGVKGQKWGVRNGPPYPIGMGPHEVRKKIAGKFQTIATNVRGKTKAGVNIAEDSGPTAKKALGADSELIKQNRRRLQECRQELDDEIFARDNEAAEKAYKKYSDEYERQVAEYEKKARMDPELKKKLLIAGGVAIGVGVAGALTYKALKNRNTEDDPFVSQLQKARAEGQVAIKLTGANNARYRNAPIDLSALSDEDTVISSNTVFHRMARNPNVSRDDGTNCLFMAYKEEDVERYKALYPFFNSNKDKGAAFKDYAIKAAEDLRMPSQKKRVETFLELAHSDSDAGRAVRDDIIRHFYSPIVVGAYGRDAVDKQVRNMSDKELLSVYRTWATLSQASRTPGCQAYFNRFLEQGYNAITDDNDSGYISDHAVICMKNNILSVVGEANVDPNRKSWVNAANRAKTYSNPGRVLVHGLYLVKKPDLVWMTILSGDWLR